MTAAKGAAMACSFAGIVLLVSGEGAGGGPGRLPGAFCCVAGAVAYGLFSVLSSRWQLDSPAAMAVIWFTVALGAGALGLATESWIPVRGTARLGLLWLGVMTNALANLLWLRALGRTEDTAAVANLAYLTPFISVALSAVFLGEPLRLRTLGALLLIVGGILLQNRAASRAAM